MSASDKVLKNIILTKVAGCMTGEKEDLQKMLDLRNIEALQLDPKMEHFLDAIDESLKDDSPFAEIFLRVGRETSNSYKKKLVRNLIYNEFTYGLDKRSRLQDGDNIAPGFIVVSPTMRCNLNCKGCYSGLYEKQGELSEDELDRIFSEARDMGIYFVVISGGEPYIMKDALLRLFKKYDDMFFLTYTNGTFLDKKTCKQLGKLGNVAPAISVEGWEKETDERRGPGMWNKINDAMDNLHNEGVLFGISVTVTRENTDTILQDRFIEYWINKGAIFGWYFMFMPVGKDPVLELVPTPEQRVHCGKRVREMRDQQPIFLADFWNDGDVVGGCLAGGRVYLHILNSGKVEPCVFAHFGVDNIRDKPLWEIANSPFFKEIRQSFPYNETGNLKRPCMIIDNPEVLRSAVKKHLIPAGHVHSEDLIDEPEVVKWIDNYAEHFKNLTEPEWLEMINDPNHRWYKGNKEYQNLFQWQCPGCGGASAQEEEAEDGEVEKNKAASAAS